MVDQATFAAGAGEVSRSPDALYNASAERHPSVQIRKHPKGIGSTPAQPQGVELGSSSHARQPLVEVRPSFVGGPDSWITCS